MTVKEKAMRILVIAAFGIMFSFVISACSSQSREVSKAVNEATVAADEAAVAVDEAFSAKTGEAIDAIENLGSVGMASEEAIRRAQELYAALDDQEKAKVSSEALNLLENASERYDELVDEVHKTEELIEAIGEVTENSADAIQAAQSSYTALSSEQKSYVTNYQNLEKCDNAFKIIQADLEYENILEYYNNGDYKMARIKLAEFLGNHPEKSEDAAALRRGIFVGLAQEELSNAQSFFDAADYESAIAILDSAIENYSGTKASQKMKTLRDTVSSELEKIRPANGEIFESTMGYGYGELTIKSSDWDAFVKLESVNDSGTYQTMYVQKNGEATMEVPDGEYFLKYATGETWYGRAQLFGSDTSYSKAETTLDFTSDSVSYTIYEVTLYQVTDGNLATTEIDGDMF